MGFIIKNNSLNSANKLTAQFGIFAVQIRLKIIQQNDRV